MRLLAALAVALALPSEHATVALSNNHAGARPVALTVSFRTELQCGRLQGRTVSLQLPQAERMPASVPASAVLIGTSTASRVAVSGRTLEIGLPVPHGVTCEALAPGVVRIAVARAANLGNPAAAASYAVVVRHATGVARGVMRIAAAG